MAELRRTPLYDWHVAHGGRMVEFGGWEMPVQYAGIVEEHQAVRTAAGLFDISHMGRLRITGPDATRFLDHVLTNRVGTMSVGQVRYSLVCNEAGGVLDDVLIYRMIDWYWGVVNASNREKIVAWLESHRVGFDVTIEDLTLSTGMIALQGPKTSEALPGKRASVWQKLKYYGAISEDMQSVSVLVSRTGYTGEDGCEQILPSVEQTVVAWENLIKRGEQSDIGLRPCGLGARDTLRLEAAMPLYGHELTENIDPLTAGLSFAVKLDKPDFVGKAALVEIAKRTDRPMRVGLKLEGRRIAREGCGVFAGEERIGEVTSGTFSPTLQQSIAMAYVAPGHATAGTTVEVDVRGKRERAGLVALPFYKRP